MPRHPPGIARRLLRRDGGALPGLVAEVRSIAEVTARIGYRWPSHVHDACEVLVPLARTYRCRIGGAEVVAEPGQVVVVQPGDAHQDLLMGGERWAGVLMALTAGSEPVPVLAPGAARVRDDRDGAVRGAWQALRACPAASPPGAQARDALAVALVWRALDLFAPDGLHPRLVHLAGERQGRRDLLAAIDAHPGDLAAAAALMGLGRDAFRRRALAWCGATPQALAEARRLDAAHARLRAGASVGEAASAAGYATPFAFSRAFRRRFGLPPSRAGG